MSESSVLTLDIGGESEDAVASVQAVAQAFEELKSASEGVAPPVDQAASAADRAGQSSQAASQPVQGFGVSLNGVGQAAGQMTSVLSRVSPQLGGVASAGQTAAGGLMQVATSAAAGSFGLAGIVTAGTAALGVLVSLGLSGANLAEQTYRLASFTGMSAEQVTFWTQAVDNAGGQTGTLERSVIRLQQAMATATSELKAGGDMSETTAALVKTLGIAIQDSSGNARTFAQVFPEVMGALRGMPDETQRNAMAMALFGRTGRELILVLEDWNHAIPQAVEETQKLGPGLQQNEEHARAYRDAMSDLEVSWQSAALQVLPTFTAALQGGAAAVQFVEGNIGKLWTVLKASPPFSVIVQGIELFKLLADAADYVWDHTRSFWEGLYNVVAAVVNPVIGLINQLIDAYNKIPLVANLPNIPGLPTGPDMTGAPYTPSGDIILRSGQVIPGRASGGSVAAGQLYRVNELGAEYFRPNVGGQIIPLGNTTNNRQSRTNHFYGPITIQQDRRPTRDSADLLLRGL